MSSSTNSLGPEPTSPESHQIHHSQSIDTLSSPLITDIRLSKRRWLILLTMIIFGLSLSTPNNTSPVLHLMLKLLGVGIHKYMYITQIFQYMMLLVVVPTACMVDKYGTKLALYVGTGLLIIHCTLKALLYYPDFPYWSTLKMTYYITSGLIGVELSAVFFCLPLKVSETWFSESERFIAWTGMLSTMTVGVCIASLVYPRIMKEVEDFKLLAYINIGFTIATYLSVLICVTTSEPKHPPSERGAKSREITSSFLKSIKTVFKNRDMVIHLIHLSIFESAMLCVGTVLQDIMTSVGHSEIFVGNFMFIDGLVSLVMQIVLSGFIHKVKNVLLVCKLASFALVIIFVIYLSSMMIALPDWVMIIVTVVLSTCKSWLMPNLTNMTAHLTSGTVPQATIIGVLMFSTVITSTITQLTFISLTHVTGGKSNYLHSLLFLMVVSVINNGIYLTFFKGRPAKTDDTANNVESSAQVT